MKGGEGFRTANNGYLLLSYRNQGASVCCVGTEIPGIGSRGNGTRMEIGEVCAVLLTVKNPHRILSAVLCCVLYRAVLYLAVLYLAVLYRSVVPNRAVPLCRAALLCHVVPTTLPYCVLPCPDIYRTVPFCRTVPCCAVPSRAAWCRTEAGVMALSR